MSRFFLSYVISDANHHSSMILSEKKDNEANTRVLAEFGFGPKDFENLTVLDYFRTIPGLVNKIENRAAKVHYGKKSFFHLTYEISPSEKAKLEQIIKEEFSCPPTYQFFTFNCKTYAMSVYKRLGVFNTSVIDNKFIDNPIKDLNKLKLLESRNMIFPAKEEACSNLLKELNELEKFIKKNSSIDGSNHKTLSKKISWLKKNITQYTITDKFDDVLEETITQINELVGNNAAEIKKLAAIIKDYSYYEDESSALNYKIRFETRQRLSRSVKSCISYLLGKTLMPEKQQEKLQKMLTMIDNLGDNLELNDDLIALFNSLNKFNFNKRKKMKQNLDKLYAEFVALEKFPMPDCQWLGEPECHPRVNIENFSEDELQQLIINQNYQDIILFYRELLELIPKKHTQLLSTIEDEILNLEKHEQKSYKELDQYIEKSLINIKKRMDALSNLKDIEISGISKIIISIIEIFESGYIDRNYPMLKANRKLKSKLLKKSKSVLNSLNEPDAKEKPNPPAPKGKPSV